MASRPVPSRPSLAFDRKQAKALLNAVRAGDARAAERFRVHHPGFSPGETDGIARAAGLHDAQLVIAREYGLPSWPRWKRFVETRRLDTGSAPPSCSAPPVAGTRDADHRRRTAPG